MSWSTKSRDEFARTTPVNPPTVNKNTNPTAQIIAGDIFNSAPYSVPIQLKTLMPVGTAITIVAVVKYARVSVSIPTVNIWCAHTTNPSTPIAAMA